MTPSFPAAAALEIRALTPASSADYFAFFDGDAFANNPRWASCYCHFLWAPTEVKPWGEWTGAENRAAVARLIETQNLRGYLAYVDGRPVGWCNATPKVRIPALLDDSGPDAAQVGAIVCFVIAKPYRRQGIARRLLQAACDGYRREGFAFAEATARLDATTDAANHTGPLQLYLSSGFAILRNDDDGSALLRKTL